MTTLAVDPGGEHFAAGYDNGLAEIRDLETGGLILSIDAHAERIENLVFAGKMLISKSRSDTLKVWDSNNGSLEKKLTGETKHSVRSVGKYGGCRSGRPFVYYKRQDLEPGKLEYGKTVR